MVPPVVPITLFALFAIVFVLLVSVWILRKPLPKNAFGGLIDQPLRFPAPAAEKPVEPTPATTPDTTARAWTNLGDLKNLVLAPRSRASPSRRIQAPKKLLRSREKRSSDAPPIRRQKLQRRKNEKKTKKPPKHKK